MKLFRKFAFTQTCSRYLETVDLDLSDAHYIQFNVISSCSEYNQDTPSYYQNQNNYYNEVPHSGYQEAHSSTYQQPHSNAYRQPGLEAQTQFGDYFEGHIMRSKRSIFGSYAQSLSQKNPVAASDSYRQLRPEVTPEDTTSDTKLVVQVSCDGSRSWSTLKSYDVSRFREPT